ncbi:hypothetical protein EJ06DRAFT_527237 [Trichodelitschia bisporula]|uniref:Uncharacterized protein n=1 Tax=Trichodelitschia bisporula TaxID=703511 RepID=A0A6G1I5Q3_9PEZI|nr:hypothetical protein EJ06DRAFT_527237 [Trichodelitschia bisporula]
MDPKAIGVLAVINSTVCKQLQRLIANCDTPNKAYNTIHKVSPPQLLLRKLRLEAEYYTHRRKVEPENYEEWALDWITFERRGKRSDCDYARSIVRDFIAATALYYKGFAAYWEQIVWETEWGLQLMVDIFVNEMDKRKERKECRGIMPDELAPSP